MQRGAPDDYQLRTWAATYPIGDLGELAARLGSIVIFDRRGGVIYLDDFNDGLLHWTKGVAGAGSSVAPSSAYARHAGCSIALTVGAVVNSSAQLLGVFPYKDTGTFGWEIAFTVNTDVLRIITEMRIYDGTYFIRPGIRYTHSTRALDYRDAAAAWVNFATGPVLREADYCFHIAKLVADIDTPAYVRFLLDGVEYDLSSYTPPKTPDATGQQINPMITLYGDATHGETIYVDDAILTIDEP